MSEHGEVQPFSTSQIVKWSVILIMVTFPLFGTALGKNSVGAVFFFAPVLIPTAMLYFLGVKSERSVIVVGALIVLVIGVGWIDFFSSSSSEELALVGPFMAYAAGLGIAVVGALVDSLRRGPAKGKS